LRNMASSPTPPTNLTAKYQKLASEYAKLRAQFGVVKAAVLDEQRRAAELAEEKRQRDVQERKRLDEMEALTFRNQQLTKRVRVLQDEADEREAKARQQKKGSAAKQLSATADVIQSTESLNSVIGQVNFHSG